MRKLPRMGIPETPPHPWDLQARASAAARALCALSDPALEGQMYFVATWRHDPPRAHHCLWDCGDGTGRQIDALTLVRTIVAPGDPEESRGPGEDALERHLLGFLGDDGLSWLPDAPWAAPWGTEFLLAEHDPGDTFCEISWAQRGTLLALCSRYRATGEERWRVAGERLVDALRAAAIPTPDGIHFPEGYYRRSGWRRTDPGLYPGIEEYNAAVAVPAIRFHRATGYAPARDLAVGLLRHALLHGKGYQADGSLDPGAGEGAGQGTLDHFHTRTNFLLAVLETGLAIGDDEWVDWARRSYHRALEWGTEFGWFPEGMGRRHAETCCVADLIEAALLLGNHVDRGYFADAEKFARNHLFESQHLERTALETAVAGLPKDPDSGPCGPFSTDSNVLETQVGAFASRPALADAFHPDATDMMQCCNAAGARALHSVWTSATRGHRIDLRLSVATPTLTVVSHEPAVGRLDVTAHRAGLLDIRLPAGVSRATVRHRDEAQEIAARDGAVQVPIEAGETVAVEYPLPERTTHHTIGRGDTIARCTAHWRGETVARVEPPGIHRPLYGPERLACGPVVPRCPRGPEVPFLEPRHGAIPR